MREIDLIVERFPSFAEAVRREYLADQTFRGVCNDFVRCLEAKERWQTSTAPEAAARVAEYGQLARDLERELSALLLKFLGQSRA